MPRRADRKILSNISLVLVSVTWGGGFIAVEIALSAGISPGLLNVLRGSLAALVILPFCLSSLRRAARREWLTGLIAGLLLTGGFIFQTVGQKYTTPSNSAFLTTLNVILVPFITWLFTKKRPLKRHILAALLSLCGIFLLTYSFSGGLSFGAGDMLVVVCALLFACHIAYLGRISPDGNPVFLTFIQMAVYSLFSLAYFWVFDSAHAAGADISRGIYAIIYLGVASCACFFLQTFAQKRVPAAQTAIFLSMEGLFGSLFSVILGFEPLTINLVSGGCVIFLAVILTELPAFWQKSGAPACEAASGREKSCVRSPADP